MFFCGVVTCDRFIVILTIQVFLWFMYDTLCALKALYIAYFFLLDYFCLYNDMYDINTARHKSIKRISGDSPVNPNGQLIVRRAGLLWSQQDFEWRWSVPLFKCLTVLEFSFILFDLCLLITFFNFIMNYVPIVTFWIFTYHKIWILSIMFCSIWSYWIIYFLACLEVSWRVVS